MRRPHVYERSAPRRKPYDGPPAPDGYRVQTRALEWVCYAGSGRRLIYAHANGAFTAARDGVWLPDQYASMAEAVAALGDTSAAEEDRKAQDRAWSGRLGITRQ